MSLTEYRQKRRFDRTPEPEPKPSDHSKRAGAPRYCIQRHHASHLHYDLRLEVGGVLKSWAIPKGPTLDPAEKRLAMMVEDHPLEYGDFEGVIPQGHYGAGSVMLWDRGSYELLGDASAEEQIQRGDFKFHLDGEKVRGDFALVRTKRGPGNQWLLIKKKDAEARPGWNPEDHARSVLTGRTQEEIAQGIDARDRTFSPARRHLAKVPGARKAPMPTHITPMLAQIGKGSPPVSEDWIYEVKWDGVRALCFLEEGRMRLISRNQNPMDQQYPELSILPHHVAAKSAILDGEIAALDEHGVPSFERLQRRITVSDPGAIAALRRSTPVVYFAFDLLYLDGYDLRGVPLIERKRLLKEILTPGGPVNFSDHFEDGPALFNAAKERGIEGIVGKKADSLYESRRTAGWLKYKNVLTDSFVLCGFTAGERELFGSLVLGIYDRGKLTWAGNVGTGFDRRSMETIYSKLAPLATQECPLKPDKNLPKSGVTWTRPELVCEVKFANWTEDGRLRAPVWMGFRPDVNPEECVRNTGGAGGQAPPARTDLLAPGPKEATLLIDGHRLKFTNLDKVFYPKDGYTKRDLLNYYDAVSPLLVPHLRDRPLSLKRYPNGIHKPFFFQKEAAESFPKWLHTQVVDDITYVIGEDRATLLFLVNLGCIDHNPYMSRLQSLEHPDYVLIDLDPQECAFEKIVEAALLVRQQLDLAELTGYPKTTGGDGMHIYIPLEPRYSYDQVRSFAQLLSYLVIGQKPDLFTTPRTVAKRQKGRVYFDWQQIARGKTISAPYSVRPYDGAPVSTPLRWREVTPKLHPQQFTMANAMARFDRVGDLFEGVLNKPQRLERALDNLAGQVKR
jgi:bifunctional non-homologous end joining protein LigD